MNEIQDEYREYRKLCRVEDDPGVTGLAQLGRNATPTAPQSPPPPGCSTASGS